MDSWRIECYEREEPLYSADLIFSKKLSKLAKPKVGMVCALCEPIPAKSIGYLYNLFVITSFTNKYLYVVFPEINITGSKVELGKDKLNTIDESIAQKYPNVAMLLELPTNSYRFAKIVRNIDKYSFSYYVLPKDADIINQIHFDSQYVFDVVS